MRVLVNMPSQHGGRPSGVALVIFRLLDELLARGRHDYVLRSPWTRDQLPDALARSALQVEVKPRPRIMVLDVLLETVRAPFVCRRLGIDLVLNADPFGAATGGKARVTLVHDLYFRTLPEQVGGRAALTMALCYNLVLSGASRIVTVSDATRADLTRWSQGFGAKARTIHSSSATALVSPNPDRLAPGRYLLLVGNATPNKNFALAARSAAALHATCPEFEIVHVGRDPDETFRTEFERLGATMMVRRMTGVSDSDLKALYRDAFALIVPSLSEGFCLPILEAQAQDCPVICASASALPEIAGDGALFFPPTEAGALVEQIDALMKTPLLRQSLVERGRKNLLRFSWAKSAEAYEQVMEDALAASRRSL